LEYRSGVETDLDNVLQIHSVFLSVSKGQTAPAEDLKKAFGLKTSTDDIIMEILKKGEMQVGEKERHAQLERVHNEVVDIVAGKLVDPKSKRVYTTGMIEKALDQLSSQGAHKQDEGAKGSGTATPTNGEEQAEGAKGKGKEMPTWTGVVTTKSAKSQALEAMKALIAWQPIPVTRARMRLRVTCPTSILKQASKSASKKDAQDNGAEDADGEKSTGTVKDRILSYVEQIESQDTMGQEWEVVGFVEPGAFKGLGEFIGGETKGRGRVEVLDMAVVHEGD
jgi:ribosome maturation protein SDO1